VRDRPNQAAHYNTGGMRGTARLELLSDKDSQNVNDELEKIQKAEVMV
jgi:hypothetical protein